jgi:hypothetical protein
MIKGNISNMPAPSLLIDGHSLVEKKFFGFSREHKFDNFISKLSRKNYRLIVWFDKDYKKYRGIKKTSPVLDGIFYQEVMVCNEYELLRFLRRRETYVLTSRDEMLSSYSFYAVDMRVIENAYKF